jgi:hypothetical protein
VTVQRQKEIRRFEIAMNDVRFVRRRERLSELDRQVEQALAIQPSDSTQRMAFE